MPLAAKLFDVSPDERRGAERRSIDRDTTLRSANGAPLDVLVRDLSCDGFRVETQIHLEIGDQVRIGLPGIGTRQAKVVRRDGEHHYGCWFQTPLDSATAARAFEVDPVVAGAFGQMPSPDYPEPHVEQWGRRTRLLLLMGATCALWSSVLFVFL